MIAAAIETSARQLSDDELRWAAVQNRNRAADGRFVYAVATTGVYCRPSCASRPARRENVSFHVDGAAAERAGFRACKRCRPDQPALAHEHASKIARACRQIEAAEEPPTLNGLARAAGLSPYHFHRVFKVITGVTPKGYATAHRARRVRDCLQASGSVTEAIYDAGFNSNGRFYAAADGMLGMKPSDYRAGGSNAEIRFALGECSLGGILVAMSARGICAIMLGSDPAQLVRELVKRFPRAELLGDDREFAAWVAKVIGFVDAPRVGLDLPLDIRGTAFQRRVWQALQAIPPGKTASYAEVAKRIGSPRAVRAVAQACATNNLAVAIPCHRVVRADGALSGYRWGVERKRDLLAREATA